MKPKLNYIKLFNNLFTKEQLIRLLNTRLKELDSVTIARIYTEVTSNEKLSSILNETIGNRGVNKSALKNLPI